METITWANLATIRQAERFAQLEHRTGLAIALRKIGDNMATELGVGTKPINSLADLPPNLAQVSKFQVKLTQVIEYEATVTADDAGEAARKLRIRALERTTAEDDISYVKRDFGVTDVHIHRITEED